MPATRVTRRDVTGTTDAGEGAEGAPEVSDRSRALALSLAVVGGCFGLHRFYTGRVPSGVWMLLTLGGCGIWYLYDVALVAAGEFRDGDGRRVARWELLGSGGELAPRDRRVADLEDRLLGVESQLSELAERMDFTERLLAQARERGSLPKS